MRDYFIADAVAEREEHAERHAERRRQTVEAGMWRQRQLPRGYRFAGPADARAGSAAGRAGSCPTPGQARCARRSRRAAGVPR